MPIVSQIVGGLGNQMFQYAMGKSLSVRHSTDLYLDTGPYDNYGLHNGFELDRVFNLQAKIATRHELRKLFGWRSLKAIKKVLNKNAFKFLRGSNYYIENGVHFNERFVSLPSTCYVAGYWQCERYFNSIENLIRSELVFRQELDAGNAELAGRIRATNSVSMHVRRGDYVSDKVTNSIIGTCPINYYQKAMKIVEKTVQDTEFFIFSDDIEWAERNLKVKRKHYFVGNNNGNNSWIDMYLISMCKHHIIANSSFGWWGAWLSRNANKTIIAPKKWYRTSTLDSKDIIPGSWIKI